MKRAIAIALMGLGLNFTGQGVADAAATSMGGLAVPLVEHTDSGVISVGSNACWWDVPVVAPGVAFFELLRDDEIYPHCASYNYAPRYYKQKRAYRRRHH